MPVLNASRPLVDKKAKFWVDKEDKNILFPHEIGRIAGAGVLMNVQLTG